MDLIKEANMRKSLTAAMAAITLGGAVFATAAPATAQRYYGGYDGYGGYGHRDYHRGNNNGAAIAAGVVGLALGAAIASNHSYSHSYNGGYDDNRGYYAPQAYAYDYGYSPGYNYSYQTCETTRWVWDSYIRRQVAIREAYAC